jgi:hypothetical protein
VVQTEKVVWRIILLMPSGTHKCTRGTEAADPGRNESRGHFTREDFAVTLTCALWKSFLYIPPELASVRHLEPYLSAALQVAEEQLRCG